MPETVATTRMMLTDMRPDALPAAATETQRLRGLHEALAAGHRLTTAIHAFFTQRDFLGVTTPLRIPAPALEDHIEAEPSGDWYLRPSPELHMKRLVAAGFERIYQLGACFRRQERGRNHLPEFTMLEWYRAHADYHAILDDTIALLRDAAMAVRGNLQLDCNGVRMDLGCDWDRLTVDEAFEAHAGIDVDAAIDSGMFEQVLVERVEPHLGRDRPTALFDFPLELGSLARRHPRRPRRVQRWELYIAGLEIANAYSELTEYREQVERFEASRLLRAAQGRDVYSVDKQYMQLLRDRRLPPCGGIALGVDRLLMVLLDRRTVDDVVPFTPETM